ncbi:MAG: hypothetical protein ACFFBI_02845 [Promethearchaeota archaeon]
MTCDYPGNGPYITDGNLTILQLASGKSFNYSFYMRFEPFKSRIVDLIIFTLPAGLCEFNWNGNNSKYYFEFCLLSIYNWDKNFPSVGDLMMSILSYLSVISIVPCLIFLIKEKNRKDDI